MVRIRSSGRAWRLTGKIVDWAREALMVCSKRFGAVRAKFIGKGEKRPLQVCDTPM